MTPATIIKNAEMDGVILALSPAGTIKATGDQVAMNRWLPMIREHKTAIVEALKGSLPQEESVAIAWLEDDRRRCRHCLNLLANGVCKVASPQGPVIANRGYRPVDILKRCVEYRPCSDDPDRRTGVERWGKPP